MKALWLVVSAWGCLLLLGYANAFLPTKLNYSDPEVIPFFCPESMHEEPWDHKAITREALRREVRRFFLEVPPPTNASFSIPEDASLSEIFRAYYGPTSSPTRFIKAVNSITWSNAMSEAGGQMRYDAPHHMDGERILEGHLLLQGRYQQIVGTVMADEQYPFARDLLGTSLNALQDFYSQTTWLELGNTDILEELGLPGMDIVEVARPNEATCTNCADVPGECRNNVIQGSKLTSGYYEYDIPAANSFIVPKPEGVGKCSHGGTMDTSINVEATGGINKETTSPCFSPHHYLHQQAVDLAIKASENYIGILRDAIGNDHFRRLLDLYPGSALSIIIDKTGSMTFEIQVVKEEARLIVEKTSPELYVLVPYGDPEYGPVTQTTDPDEFLAELDKLEAFGGVGGKEEKFWHGLQLALVNTPDYSNIYCFTDAGGNDAEIMEGVMALASSKHCKVNIIYSYENGRKRTHAEEVLSGVEDYKRLAAQTGGQFIEIDKFDVDEIVGILEDGVKESEVSVRMRKEVSGMQDVTFPIDDSVSQFVITISGEVTTAMLSDGGAYTYDLMDESALQNSAGVEIVSHTPSLKSLKFSNHTIGDWQLQVDGGLEEFNVAVSATSTLGFLAEFCDLLLEPPRPSYRVIFGRPLTDTEYYIEVTFVGYLESGVEHVTAMELVDEQGIVQTHVDYYGEVDDHFYIYTEVFPNIPFYIQVDGTLASGKAFSRIFPTMVVPVQCSVELLVDTSVMSARAGETAIAYFRVTNYGPDATFDLFAGDEKKYITDWTPKAETITSMGSVDITVTFTVPSDAEAGTVSTVTVTASSKLHEHNVNTAINYFFVLPEEQDMEAPTCVSNDEPNCLGYDTEDTCNDQTWTVVATLHDVKSGLETIYSKPSENLTLDAFTEGTISPVQATFFTTCCTRDVEIIGVDKQGNIGRCQWDLGDLHGSILEFVVESVGQTWAYLRWTISEVREDLLKYTILTNDDISTDSRCPGLTCHLNVTYLEPCTLQKFSLTPHYDGVDAPGKRLFAEDTTLDVDPKTPTNPETEYTTETSTTIKWEGPLHHDCVEEYEVCYTMVSTTDATCVNVEATTYAMVGLEACTLYYVSITALSISGKRSDSLEFITNTDDAAPGAPENVQLHNQTAHWVELSWDNPKNRANCVDRWMVSYAEIHEREMTVTTDKSGEDADNYATVDDLLACTNYTFWVSAVSFSGLAGSTETTFAAMAETDPTPVESVEATSDDTSSVDAIWHPAKVEECVDHYHVCLESSLTTEEICHDTSDLEKSFTGLDPCVDYEVTVSSVSPAGHLGGFVYDIATTKDLPTSPPTNLKIVDIESNTAVATFGPPIENPQCVYKYETRLVELDEFRRQKVIRSGSGVEIYLEEVIKGLEACRNYGVWVSATTPSGYVSSEVNANFTTTEALPSAPRQLSHSHISQDSVSLVWFEPEDNALCVELYHVTWTSDKDNGSDDYPPSSTEVLATISGLSTCTTYTFTVSTRTPSGAEGPSISYDAKTAC